MFFLLHSTILSACQYVGSTAPTVLPIRKAPLVLVYDRGPLRPLRGSLRSGNLIASRQAHFSTITRLPSGSSTSHSGAFRDGVLGLRGRYCPPRHGRVWRHSSHTRSARDVSFGVSLCIHPHLCGLWFRVEYHPSPYPRTSAASAQSRLAQRLRSTRLMLLVLPALVVEPILSENRRKRLALAPIGCFAL